MMRRIRRAVREWERAHPPRSKVRVPPRFRIRPNSIVHKLLYMQGGACALCGRAVTVFVAEGFPEAHGLATIDHIKPRSAGGTDDLGNLQAVHWLCNNKRGNMRLERARRKLAEPK